MRSYSMIFPSFWTGRTGKEIKKMGKDCQILAFYLLTSPHAMNSHGIGIYYLPLDYMIHDTGLDKKALTKALQRLIEGQFCNYDPLFEYVWIVEMAKFQIGKLRPLDKQVLGIKKILSNLPVSLCFLYGFYQKYQHDFHLQEEAKRQGPSKALTKPLRSQEQEHDQEQEKILNTFVQRGVELEPTDGSSGASIEIGSTPPPLRQGNLYFEKFWASYPRKQDKQKSLEIWKRKKLDRFIDLILADLPQRTDWNAGSEYTPLPTTYLNRARWEDEEKNERKKIKAVEKSPAELFAEKCRQEELSQSNQEDENL